MKRMSRNRQVSDAASSHRQSIEIDMYFGEVLFKKTTDGPLYLYVKDESDELQSYLLDDFIKDHTIKSLSLVFDHRFARRTKSPSVEEYVEFWDTVKDSLERLRLVFVSRTAGSKPPIDISTTNLYQALEKFTPLQELQQLEIVYDDDNIDKWIPKIFTRISNVCFSRTTNAYPGIIKKAENLLYCAVDNVSIGDSTHKGKTQVSFYRCETIHIVGDLDVTYEILLNIHNHKVVVPAIIRDQYRKQLVTSKIKIFIPLIIKSQEALADYHNQFKEFFKNITYFINIEERIGVERKKEIKNFRPGNSVKIEENESVYAFEFKRGYFKSLKDFLSRNILQREYQKNRRESLKTDSASANKQLKVQKEDDVDGSRLNTVPSSSSSSSWRAREDFPLPPIQFTGGSHDFGNESAASSVRHPLSPTGQVTRGAPADSPFSPPHWSAGQNYGNEPAASPVRHPLSPAGQVTRGGFHDDSPYSPFQWQAEHDFEEELAALSSNTLLSPARQDYGNQPAASSSNHPPSPAGQVSGNQPTLSSAGSSFTGKKREPPKPMSFEAGDWSFQDSTYRTPGVPGEYVSRQMDLVSDADGGEFFWSMMDKIAGHSDHNS